MTASFMLHGRPGIGKTEIVQALAEATGAEFVDLRLTTVEPQDLRGLPYFDHETRRTVWYRPEDLPDDPARPAILFRQDSGWPACNRNYSVSKAIIAFSSLPSASMPTVPLSGLSHDPHSNVVFLRSETYGFDRPALCMRAL